MFIFSVWLSLSLCVNSVLSLSCGIDKSQETNVHEGYARMETYPWLGVLYYPYKKKRFTTAVVLVTRQIVLTTALEIDKLPKEDFRARARVIVGRNCSSARGIGIRDYTYYHDYSQTTFSSIALIQLETDHVTAELRPICPPPKVLVFQNEEFYAMVLSDDCNQSKMKVHRMNIVSTEACQTYYRRAQLDIPTLWPTYTACARGISGDHCVWRSGAILVMKIGSRWSLLGFGVYGPGCRSPARFLDYGMYYEWVQRSIERIGQPAISKVASNHIVMRRTLSKLQRFGPCDRGEVKRELYTESTVITKAATDGIPPTGKYQFNLTIISDVEYECVVLRASYSTKMKGKPTLRLRRYCANYGQTGLCFTGVQFIQIQFYVEIEFEEEIEYSVKAYGRTVRSIDPFTAHKYANTASNVHPVVPSYETTLEEFKENVKDDTYPLYGKKFMKTRVVTGLPLRGTPRPPTTQPTTPPTTTAYR